MPRHETAEDEQKEIDCCRILEEWFNYEGAKYGSYDVRHLPTPHDEQGNPTPFPDFMVYRDGRHTHYGEIKHFNIPVGVSIRKGGVLLDNPKYEELLRYTERGFKTLLVIKHTDHPYILSTIRNLEDNRNLWSKALSKDMMTTNHGQGRRQSPYPGWRFPVDLFTEVE